MVYIGSDHGGFDLKNELKDFLNELKYEIEDLGAHEKVMDDDYPDFVIPVAQKVAQTGGFGIVIGRSGVGESITANKVKGVRAVVCRDTQDAKLAREKNDANVVSLGADFTDSATAKDIVKVFLETQFSRDERHARRVEKINVYELAHSK